MSKNPCPLPPAFEKLLRIDNVENKQEFYDLMAFKKACAEWTDYRILIVCFAFF